MKHSDHLSSADKEVLAFVVGNQKSESVWMTLDTPGNQVKLVDNTNGIPSVADDLALAFHCRESADYETLFMRFDAEKMEQL